MAEHPLKRINTPVVHWHHILKNHSLLFVMQFMVIEERQFVKLQHILAPPMAHATWLQLKVWGFWKQFILRVTTLLCLTFSAPLPSPKFLEMVELMDSAIPLWQKSIRVLQYGRSSKVTVYSPREDCFEQSSVPKNFLPDLMNLGVLRTQYQVPHTQISHIPVACPTSSTNCWNLFGQGTPCHQVSWLKYIQISCKEQASYHC
jgi:hypothetical protein